MHVSEIAIGVSKALKTNLCTRSYKTMKFSPMKKKKMMCLTQIFYTAQSMIVPEKTVLPIWLLSKIRSKETKRCRVTKMATDSQKSNQSITQNKLKTSSLKVVEFA
jgi:hypothetical protein